MNSKQLRKAFAMGSTLTLAALPAMCDPANPLSYL